MYFPSLSYIVQVMCLLANNNAQKYNIIKTLLCIHRPVPSQCVVLNTITRPRGLMSVATKVAIQVNCKLGGEPWALPLPVCIIIAINFFFQIHFLFSCRVQYLSYVRHLCFAQILLVFITDKIGCTGLAFSAQSTDWLSRGITSTLPTGYSVHQLW